MRWSDGIIGWPCAYVQHAYEIKKLVLFSETADLIVLMILLIISTVVWD